MATPYSVVFDKFMNLITDYSFYNLPEEDLTILLTIYLDNACTKFTKCLKNLDDRTPATETSDGFFNIDLSNMEILILSHYMVDEWLSPKINTSDLLKQILGSKDYTLFSQANQLKQLRELREDTQNEINRLIIDYTYKFLSIDDIS